MGEVAQLKAGSINEMEYQFCLKYVSNGGFEDRAYKEAFHDEIMSNIDLNNDQDIADYCRVQGFNLVNNPRIKKIIQGVVLEAFSEDAVSARHVLVEVMEDKTTPPAVRRMCATDILNIAKIDPGKTINVKGMNTDPQKGFDLSKLSKEEQDQMEQMLIKMYEEESDDDRDPAQDVDDHLHQSAPDSAWRERPRSPNSKNFSTAMVPMKLISA